MLCRHFTNCTGLLLGALVLLAASASQAAEEGLHLPHNHLAFIIGHAEEEQKNGHHESGTVLGLDYVRQFHRRWGLGATFELESFGDNQKRHSILAFPVSYFPGGHWRLFGAPGVEFSEPWEADKAVFRLGVGYEFHLNKRLTLSPEVQVDFVEGGTKVFVVGLALGVGF